MNGSLAKMLFGMIEDVGVVPADIQDHGRVHVDILIVAFAPDHDPSARRLDHPQDRSAGSFALGRILPWSHLVKGVLQMIQLVRGDCGREHRESPSHGPVVHRVRKPGMRAKPAP